MRKSTIEKMEEHINILTEVPENIKKQYRKKLFTNLIFCIIFIIYITGIILGKSMLKEEMFINYYKIASMVSLLIAIILFECAYKKDNGYIALYGIEIFVISLVTLFLKNILKFEIPMWFKISGLYVCIYYLIKCLIIYKREKNIYLRQNNDLQEITKKESQDKLKTIMEQKNKENIDKEKTKKKTNTEKKSVSTTKKKKDATTKTRTTNQTKNSEKKSTESTKKKETKKKEVKTKNTEKKEKK